MRVKRKRRRKVNTNINLRLFVNHILNERSYCEQQQLFEYIYKRYKGRLNDEDFNINVEKLNLKNKLNGRNIALDVIFYMIVFSIFNTITYVVWSGFSNLILIIILVILVIAAVSLIVVRKRFESDLYWIKTSLEILAILEEEEKMKSKKNSIDILSNI